MININNDNLNMYNKKNLLFYSCHFDFGKWLIE